MILMHYRFVFPTDYPMSRIEQRIEEKGAVLDGYPGLHFKAYLYRHHRSSADSKDVNSYAPFYVWENHEAMMRFLKSDGFKALCQQFGRPAVQTWFTDDVPARPTASQVYADIIEQADDEADIQGQNYQTWSHVSVRWLSESELVERVKTVHHDDAIRYQIGYVTQT